MQHMKIEIPSAVFLVIALLLINLMLGISSLRHSSIFLHLEAEYLISLKILLCEWGQSLTCSAWFVYWFIFLKSVAGSSVSTAGSRRSLLSNCGGVTWCTSRGFQMECGCFSPSHMASHTEIIFMFACKICLWENLSEIITPCYYANYFIKDNYYKALLF